MKAIILAAGRGSRMLHLTADQPKCLTKLAGKSMLDWQQLALKAAGIKKITVIAGYKGASLHGQFEKIENPFWAVSNMVRTLCQASHILEKHEVIISYSDIVYSSDHISMLLKCNSDIAITYDKDWFDLWSLRFDDPLSDAESFKVNKRELIEIGSSTNTIDNIQGQYMGLLRMTPSGWSCITSILKSLKSEEIDKLDMTALLSLLIQNSIPVEAIEIRGQWCEADSDTDIQKYENKLSAKEPWKHDWRNKSINL